LTHDFSPIKKKISFFKESSVNFIIDHYKGTLLALALA
jgi:hypothetical protein